MAKDLLDDKVPLIKFPATSRPEVICSHHDFHERIWGWTSQTGEKITIFYPRLTFFLPRDQFLDTIVRELTHFIVNIIENNPLPKHGKKWYF